ncbi:MAG: TetR/AcrR family transcriptional regulator [Sphingomonadales bacterium]|nr:MAG: TetR/AcrR family transcriptional regulator [Sphingomonadales bacterium]
MAEKKARRPRDPGATREVILDAALKHLAEYGPDGLSLSEVARLAGVNRGTAYQHFDTREKLIKATIERVSERMREAVFGGPEMAGERREQGAGPMEFTDRIARFGMENPELCRIWLFDLLSSEDPSADPFWKEYADSLGHFSRTEGAQKGVDSEVLSVILVASAFLWPVWAQAHDKDGKDRRALARRYARETLRLSLYGSMKAAYFPQIAERLAEED